MASSTNPPQSTPTALYLSARCPTKGRAAKLGTEKASSTSPARNADPGPIALDRLSVDGDGLVVYALKHAFHDGRTHVLFEPLDFISRLAALVPRPCIREARILSNNGGLPI